MTTKILTQGQAESIYLAIYILNNIGARGMFTVEERSEGDCIKVNTLPDGRIRVLDVWCYRVEKSEEYPSQNEFAEFYKI